MIVGFSQQVGSLPFHCLSFGWHLPLGEAAMARLLLLYYQPSPLKCLRNRYQIPLTKNKQSFLNKVLKIDHLPFKASLFLHFWFLEQHYKQFPAPPVPSHVSDISLQKFLQPPMENRWNSIVFWRQENLDFSNPNKIWRMREGQQLQCLEMQVSHGIAHLYPKMGCSIAK